MIASALLVLVAQTLPTLAAVRALPPAQAGERVLAGLGHDSIVAILPDPNPALTPPGTIDLDLVERATASGDMCTRKRWRVTFRQRGTGALDSATPDQRRGFPEIALAQGGACPADGYARVQQGTSPETGMAALRQFHDLLASRTRVTFDCRDETRSGLCGSTGAIRRALAGLTPWMVSQSGSRVEFWLGRPGGVVTIVQFDVTEPTRMQVTRRIPAPA